MREKKLVCKRLRQIGQVATIACLSLLIPAPPFYTSRSKNSNVAIVTSHFFKNSGVEQMKFAEG